MSELTEAIRQGDATRVADLLDADPSLTASSENGVTPILLAIYHGKPEIAQLCVARGAARGRAPSFPELCALGELEAVKARLAAEPSVLDARSGDGFPPLGLAIFFRHPGVARHLIEAGADVNAVSENAQRVAPLHAAASVGDLETTRLLLERGADPNLRQQLDYTPLHGLAGRGDVEMAKLLLSHGADRNARSSDGMTPADVARKHGQEQFAEWIDLEG